MILPAFDLGALWHKALSHWRFFQNYRVLRRREAVTILSLATLTVIAEASGMTMILPILSFVEQGRDVVAFSESSRFAGIITTTFNQLNVPIGLISLSAVALFFIIVRQVVNFFNSIEAERIKWTIGRRLSIRLFQALLGSSASNIHNYKAGEFTVASDYECQAAAAIAQTYISLWMSIVSFSAYGAVLFITAPLASLLATCLIVTIMVCLGFLIKATRRLSSDGLDIRRIHIEFLNERFRAWKLIKLSNSLDIETKNAEEVADRMVNNKVQLAKISGLILVTFVPIMSVFWLFTLYMFVEVFALDVATVVLFIMVLLRLMPVSQGFQKQISMLAKYDPSLHMIDKTLRKSEACAEDLHDGKNVSAFRQSIEFENVSFTYNDREQPALRNVTVSVPAKRLIAIIGHSGAGKSTLVDLIPRIIEPNSGSICLDGVPLAEFALASLRRLVAYVPQSPFLFDATVTENIRYMRPQATDEEIIEAAKLANADEFIQHLPNGYNTYLGDDGANLSGGQRQRIVLARAFLSGAPLLILDEPTSALDYESESAIKLSIERMVAEHERTVIVIAHRLSTVENADLVIHLDDGKVQQTGSADAVLSKVNGSRLLLQDEN